MTDVPDDILAIAKDIADSITSPDMAMKHEIYMVAGALMAERARCAKLIEGSDDER